MDALRFLYLNCRKAPPPKSLCKPRDAKSTQAQPGEFDWARKRRFRQRRRGRSLYACRTRPMAVSASALSAIPAGSRIYLDTNVWIYALEGFESFNVPLAELFARVDNEEITAVTSELTLAEGTGHPPFNRSIQNSNESIWMRFSQVVRLPSRRSSAKYLLARQSCVRFTPH